MMLNAEQLTAGNDLAFFAHRELEQCFDALFSRRVLRIESQSFDVLNNGLMMPRLSNVKLAEFFVFSVRVFQRHCFSELSFCFGILSSPHQVQAKKAVDDWRFWCEFDSLLKLCVRFRLFARQTF